MLFFLFFQLYFNFLFNLFFLLSNFYKFLITLNENVRAKRMFGIYLSKNQNKWIDYWKKQPIYTENVVFCRLPASLLLLYLFSICDSLSILCVLRVCRLSLQPYVLGFAADSKPTFLHQHQCIEMGRTRDDTKHLMMHTQHTAYSKRARARYSHVHRMEMLWGTRTLRSLSHFALSLSQ